MPACSTPVTRAFYPMWFALGFAPHRLLCAYAGRAEGVRVYVRPSRIVCDSFTLWFADGTKIVSHWIPAHDFVTFFAPDPASDLAPDYARNAHRDTYSTALTFAEQYA